MKIGLIDVDGHNGFPNLALMKLSAFHKQKGDQVSFFNPMYGNYDKVYKSKVFTFSPDYLYHINCDDVVKGGTGYGDYRTVLHDDIEHICPDYSLYAIDYAIGFLTRGCPNKCKWCIVPDKEGGVIANQDIEEFLGGKKQAVLLDNNVLSCDFGLKQIEKIIKLGVKIDFNQGLDARIISGDMEIVKLLAKMKWIRYIRLACDTRAQIPHIEKCLTMFKSLGVSESHFFVYTLIRDFEDSLYRIRRLKTLGCKPFAQPYLSFTGRRLIPQWQKDMARWCNQKRIFKSVDFEEYEPRKGFKCKQYIKNNSH